MTQLSRRQFIVTSAAAGGFALGLVPDPAAAAPAPANAGPVKELNPWIVIAPDGTVTIRVAGAEFGNGYMTQVALTVAEELHCDWSRIRTEFASTTRDFLTYGVYSTPVPAAAAFFGGRSTMGIRLKQLQQVGASARERLKAAAAAEWGVPVAEVTAENSVLAHGPSGRTLSYGAVAPKAAAIRLAAEPAIKTEAEWRLLGKASPPKLNLPEIVTGTAQYGIDVRPPGMVYAALKQSPVHGGRLKSHDEAAVRGMPGVLAVVTVDPAEPRGVAIVAGAPFGYGPNQPRAAVAVIAEHYWQARQALDKLPVEWDDGAGAQWKDTTQLYDAVTQAVNSDKGVRVEKQMGDVSAVKGGKTVEQTYLTPYCDQAPMEPLNGTALVTEDRVELWHPGQNTQQSFWVASDEAGMLPERVTVHQTYVGGAFGRRLEGDDVRMVVAVAKKFPGRPVQVIWSREEMMRQGRYRPLVAAKLTAALDRKTGLPAALTVRQAGRGHYPRFADSAWFMGPIPNVRVDARELPIHITPGPYRGPGYNSYAFMMETFIDECAEAAGADPLAYRLKLLEGFPNPGWAKCLREVADKAVWGRTLPAGRAQGLAISAWGMNGQPGGGTCVAVVADVEVSKQGVIKVHQLDVAFDCGKVMNRDAAETLMAGGVLYGLNMALNEELTVQDGRIVEGNFDTYPILRTGDAPVVNIHWGGLSGADHYAEVGEPPVGPVGPAVGNAIYKVTGKRLRRQPFAKQDLSWA